MKRVGFIFPGQGSQALGMGKDFYENFEFAKEAFEIASNAIEIDFKQLLFKEEKKLNESHYTQPAILLVSYIASKLFENEMSIKPVFALGHSLGEFSALACVGAFELEKAIKTVHIRGLLMQKVCIDQDVGMMVVLGLDDDTVQKAIKDAQDNNKKIYIANYNSDAQIVLAGNKNDLNEIAPKLKELKAKRTMLLNMSVASHCPILQDAVKPLEHILKENLQDTFLSPVISNVTAQKYASKQEALELLPKQLVSSVKYKQSIKNYEDEIDLFIEFGHGSILKGINKKITSKPTISINNKASLESAFEEIV
jgi:[acyl-carrier-protein] S-malonyltransferase